MEIVGSWLQAFVTYRTPVLIRAGLPSTIEAFKIFMSLLPKSIGARTSARPSASLIVSCWFPSRPARSWLSEMKSCIGTEAIGGAGLSHYNVELEKQTKKTNENVRLCNM